MIATISCLKRGIVNRKELFLGNARIDNVISTGRYYMQRKVGPGYNRAG
jgi:hypothetical protein